MSEPPSTVAGSTSDDGPASGPGSGPAPGSATGVDAEKVARGTRYTAVAQGAALVLRLGSNVVLARLLLPSDFGVFAIAAVVGLVLERIKDLGTGSAVIQREKVDDALLNSVFYLNMAIGTFLFALMFALARPIAVGLGSPNSTHAIQALGGLLLVTAGAQIHHALLRRHLRWDAIAMLTVLNAGISAVVSVITAFAGFGYWSMVIGMVVSQLVDIVLVWRLDPWRPKLQFSIASINEIRSFSIHLFLYNLTFLMYQQVDKLIVGHFLGPSHLGTYSLSQRTVTSPLASVSSVVNEVSFPAYARNQNDDAALRSGMVSAAGVVALVTFPAMFGLAALAEPAVHVVFGARWDRLIPVIWFLAPVAAIQSVTLNGNDLLFAKGRTDLANRWAFITFVVLTALELVFVQYGLVAMAGGILLGTILLTPFGLRLAFGQIGLPMGTYLRGLWPLVWITAVMTAATWGASQSLASAGAPYWARLLVGLAVGGVVYVGLLALARPPAVRTATSVLRRRGAASAT